MPANYEQPPMTGAERVKSKAMLRDALAAICADANTAYEQLLATGRLEVYGYGGEAVFTVRDTPARFGWGYDWTRTAPAAHFHTGYNAASPGPAYNPYCYKCRRGLYVDHELW